MTLGQLVRWLLRDRNAEQRVAREYRNYQAVWKLGYATALKDGTTLRAERDRYREALERIAGPVDRPFLGYDGKLAARALDRPPAVPEEIAARAERDFEHYLRGVVL